MLGSPFHQSQNLVKQVSAEAVMRPTGFYKAAALDVLSVLAALVAGFVYRSFLFGKFSFSLVLVAVGAFAVLSILQVFLSKNFTRRVVVLLLEVTALLLFFYDFDPRPIGREGSGLLFLLGTGVLLYLFFLWGELAAYRDMNNALEVKFFRVARFTLRKLTTGLVAAGILLYLPQWNVAGGFVSEPTFDRLFASSSSIAENAYPDVRFDSTVQHFAESLALHELKKDPKFLNLPPREQAEAQSQATAQIITALGQTLAMEIDVQKSLSETLYRFAVRGLEGSSNAYGANFLYVWAIVAFLALRGLGVFVYALYALVAFFLYQLLLAMNFVSVSGESHLREVVNYT